MTTTRNALTDTDVRTLLKGATADERALAAHKLCRVIDRETLDEEGRAQAQDILRVMASDAEELVRRALAVTLKASPLVPRDVALKLARDVESICLPVLNFSPAFTDDDLSEIVKLGGPVRQVAIAKRPKLSEKVTDAIVEHGVETAVQTAVSNDNASFSERSLSRALQRFEKSEKVLAAVAYRDTLPLSILSASRCGNICWRIMRCRRSWRCRSPSAPVNAPPSTLSTRPVGPRTRRLSPLI
jgi:uncharacterized protein (DUF2336 family)